MKNKLMSVLKYLYMLLAPVLFITSVLGNFYMYELYAKINPRITSLELYATSLTNQLTGTTERTYRNFMRIEENTTEIKKLIPAQFIKIKVEGDKK